MARGRLGCGGWIGVAALVVMVVGGAVAYRAYRAAAALADTSSVLFDSDCTGTEWSPSHEPISCAGGPRLKIVVDGKDETAQGDLRALHHGAHVVFTVEPTVDSAASLRCSIVLVGYQRTLVTNTGTNVARCEGTIP